MLKCLGATLRGGLKQIVNLKRTPVRPNLKAPGRPFHSTLRSQTRIFVDHENVHAYRIIQAIPVAVDTENYTFVSCEVEGENEFINLLQQNWRSSTAGDILDAFKNAANYCVLNNIPISDSRFDNLVDGLMDHVECLTDDELSELLATISRYPACESYKSHNYHDVWSCLDDICCWRLTNWSTDTILQFANHWYKLNLGRVSDFLYEAIQKFSRRPDKLTKDQLVHTFFYMNICRKRSIEFVFESALDAVIDQLTVDEMAVCAMGFFKSQSKVKISHLLDSMIRKVIEEVSTIHEMSLCPILKIIKYSNHIALSGPMKELLDSLVPQVDRLSNVACVHIALLGTNVYIYHEGILEKITEKLSKDISNTQNVRLKDIERLLLSLTMFNLHPATPIDIFEASYKELHRDERLKENIQYPRTLIACLMHLAMKNMYSHELMHTVLDQDYIVENFGKIPNNY